MPRFTERHDVCGTDTQYVVQLSGYTWALQQIGRRDALRILDAACRTGFGIYALAHRASSAVGLDLAPETIAEARAQYRAPFIIFTPYGQVHTTTPENPYHLREDTPESLWSLLHRHFATVRLFGRRQAPALRRAEEPWMRFARKTWSTFLRGLPREAPP